MSDPEPQPTADTGLTVFCQAPFDILEDLCGDPLTAELNVLVAGNQFMVMPDLIDGFVRSRAGTGGVFYETLPPGIIIDQARHNGLRVGTLELRVQPDVVAASPDALAALQRDGLCGPSRRYASNDLTVLVAAGNPAGIASLADLGRPDIRVAIPDPATEGIGVLALGALQAAGGSALRSAVEVEKRADGTAMFTTIHHRQSPAWLQAGVIDAAVVWSTEAAYHIASGAPFEQVTIDPGHNQTGGYAAAVLTDAPHPETAQAFVDYLAGPAGQHCYQRYGFDVPAPTVTTSRTGLSDVR